MTAKPTEQDLEKARDLCASLTTNEVNVDARPFVRRVAAALAAEREAENEAIAKWHDQREAEQMAALSSIPEAEGPRRYCF